MGITVRPCRVCGGDIAMMDEDTPEVCLECSLQLTSKLHEAEWKNLTTGHSCPSGRCNL